MPKDKIIAFDFLRVFAIFSVIVLHTSAELFLNSFSSYDWTISNVYEAFSRWNVPIFFMISGALFLRKDKILNIKKLYSKNILRIISIFLCWSLVYALLIPSYKYDLKYLLYEVLLGPFHFWFLKVLIGLYIAIPIYKHIVSNKNLEIYFLYIAFFLGILLPSVLPLIGLINNPLEIFLINFYESFNIKIASTYSFYFVLGHYLIEYPIKNSYKCLIYILGAISPFIVMLSTHYISFRNNAPISLFLENSFLCTALEAIAIFVFFTSRHKFGKINYIFEKLSSKVLGIYIVHILVMWILSENGIKPNTYSASFFIPIYSLMVFIISYIVVAILQKIPFIKKWLI